MDNMEESEEEEVESYWVFPRPEGYQGAFEPIETPPNWKLRWTKNPTHDGI